MQDDAFDGALSSLADSGLALLRGALHPALVRELGEAAGTLYERVERAARNAGPAGVERVLPRGCRFLPTASSLTLAALDEESGRDVAGAILRTRLLRSTLVASLDGPFRIDLDQAWLRRQSALRRCTRPTAGTRTARSGTTSRRERRTVVSCHSSPAGFRWTPAAGTRPGSSSSRDASYACSPPWS